MNLMKVILFFMFLLGIGCKAYKNNIEITGENSDFIENAIFDFSKSSLFKNGFVFQLRVEKVNEDTILVTIIEGGENKYLYSNLKNIDENNLPSRCLELDNKLFVWRDDAYKINKKIFDLLMKYNLLQDDEGGMVLLPDSAIDDSKKGADYFFCIRNSKIYKRIISNKGHVPIPVIKCE